MTLLPKQYMPPRGVDTPRLARAKQRNQATTCHDFRHFDTGGFKDLSTSRPKNRNAIFVLSGVFRHNDVESASLTKGALSPDAPPMHFYELFG